MFMTTLLLRKIQVNGEGRTKHVNVLHVKAD